jgi:hypothetical protein
MSLSFKQQLGLEWVLNIMKAELIKSSP